jgi:hypothetical protein
MAIALGVNITTKFLKSLEISAENILPKAPGWFRLDINTLLRDGN